MPELNIRRILITGGAGFVGYHLAKRLSEDLDNQIVLADNFARGKNDEELESLIKRKNISLIAGDLTDNSTFEKLGTGYDEVYHLAAIIGVRNVLERPHDVVRVNAISTLLLLEWFVKGGGDKLVFSSTSEAYAWTQQFHSLPVPTPEDVPLSLTDLKNSRASYAGSKIFGELSVIQYCTIYQKPFVNLRYHNVYGPRMGNEHVIPELYSRVLSGQNPLKVYSANHSRAFCYISDAVQATIDAMRRKEANSQTINIGNDLEEVTIGELANRIIKKTKNSPSVLHQEAVNDPIVRRCPDLTRARQLLSYNPEISLDAGLDLTLEWYSQKVKLQAA
jgi:UDP-glucose 4-epimerase